MPTLQSMHNKILSVAASTLLVVLSLCLAGCSSFRVSYTPALKAENDVLVFEVDKVRVKARGDTGDDLLVWSRITNKTRSNLVFVKQNYHVDVEGNRHKGYVGHGIKLDRGFRVLPMASKVVRFCFRGLPRDIPTADILIQSIQVEGVPSTHEISLAVPVGKTM